MCPKFTPALQACFRLVFSIYAFAAGSAFSQVYYSANPDYIRSKTEGQNLISGYKSNYPDTALTGFADYFPRNFLGNVGLPSPRYILEYGTDPLGFRLYEPPYPYDRFTEKDVQYLRTAGPYANLTGVAGSRQLQILKMNFTHTYQEKVNVALGFNRYTSTGFYKRQQTYTNNFWLSSNYTNRHKRVGYFFYILNNGNKNAENGGLRSRLNDTTMSELKELQAVRITAASRDNRETKIVLNPWLRISRRNDSLRPADHYLSLKSRVTAAAYQYRDNNMAGDGFYKNAFLDTTATFDSTNVKQLVNELAYSIRSLDGRKGVAAGYSNEIDRLWQYSDSVFSNHLLFLNARYGKEKTDSSGVTRYLDLDGDVQYILAGPNAANYKTGVNGAYFLNKQKHRSVFLHLLFENRNPDHIYSNWVSNHFYWLDNVFLPVRKWQLSGGFALNRHLKLSGFYENIANLLYFGHDAMPRQMRGAASNAAVALTVNKVLFRHLGFFLEHRYQQTSAAGAVRLPANITTAKLYYTGALFKNNLHLQVGLQGQVYQAFTPYAYMPATQAFYLQDSVSTSSYPYVDLYLSARIRPVSVFVKVENVLQGYAGNDYFLVPGYYQPDRAFRFGISWMFFD